MADHSAGGVVSSSDEPLRPLHVVLLVFERADSSPETLEVDVEVSDNATVAELKVILESSDLIPSSSDDEADEQLSAAVRGHPVKVCVRLNAHSAVLRDDEVISRGERQVQVLVLPADAATPAAPPAASFSPERGARRRLPPVITPAHVEDIPYLLPPLSPSGPLSSSSSSMQALMNTTLVRSLLRNPEVLRSLLDSNPQMQELRERNPELNALFNDPDLFRQSIEAMQNPSLLREMVSNTDRALSNIDALPGGFNALRRVYKDIQSPLWNATSGINAQQAEQRYYSVDTSSPEPSCAPVPNPFALRRHALSNDDNTTNVTATHPPVSPKTVSRRRKVPKSYPQHKAEDGKISGSPAKNEAPPEKKESLDERKPPSAGGCREEEEEAEIIAGDQLPLPVERAVVAAAAAASAAASAAAASAPGGTLQESPSRPASAENIRRAIYGTWLPGLSIFQRRPPAAASSSSPPPPASSSEEDSGEKKAAEGEQGKNFE